MKAKLRGRGMNMRARRRTRRRGVGGGHVPAGGRGDGSAEELKGQATSSCPPKGEPTAQPPVGKYLDVGFSNNDGLTSYASSLHHGDCVRVHLEVRLRALKVVFMRN
jgi:hypothetical protein